MISMILSSTVEGGIGYKNDLIWKNSEDMKRFKLLTTNNWIIMGRKTAESLPKFPLLNRKNIVISRQDNITIHNTNDFYSSKSLEEAINLAKMNKESFQEIFIIGGSEIFNECLEKKLVDRIYLTLIHEKIPFDTSIKPINILKWKVINSENHSNFSFMDLEKIK